MHAKWELQAAEGALAISGQQLQTASFKVTRWHYAYALPASSLKRMFLYRYWSVYCLLDTGI